jgi:hypothetical protein
MEFSLVLVQYAPQPELDKALSRFCQATDLRNGFEKEF